jgi:hypothetical protein
MTSYRFNDLVQIKFLPVQPQVLEIEISKSRYHLATPNFSVSYGLYIDHNSLNHEEKQLFEAGDLIPSISYYWLNLCSRIIRNSLRKGQVSILSVPSRNLLIPLCVGDLCEQIHGQAWMSTAEVLIAWGVEPTIYNHPIYPIKCLGAVFPIIDGLGIAWKASSEEFIELSELKPET